MEVFLKGFDTVRCKPVISLHELLNAIVYSDL